MVWGNPPPPLAMPSPRRLSISSVSSLGSSRSSSPALSGLNSSSALILVHDPEDSNTPFDFSSDEDDDDSSPQFESRRASTPPLCPTVVFLYLLTPYLKLGAMFFPYIMLPFKYRFPSLFLFAVLSGFARQVMYMLARYMRTADLEDIILDSFARGRGKERRRNILRSTVRTGTGSLRILLAAVYLRESAFVLLPLFPDTWSFPVQPILTIGLALLALPLSLAQSLASKRIVYITWLSLVTYLAWLGCISYAHSQGNLPIKSSWLRMGTLWQGTTAIAFAFTSSSTLPLYASLKGTIQPITTVKPSKARSFKNLSVLSVAVALLLTVPLVIFSTDVDGSNTLLLSQPPPTIVIPILNGLTLLLGIPALIVTTPPLPIPERIRHSTTFQISKSLLSVLYIAFALVPVWLSRTLNDILLVSALASTYFLPALIHVTAHFFKRPLSIVMPQIPSTPLVNSETPESDSPRSDELLLRKERALQKKQFKKRVVWDIGVWILLVGSGAGTVWIVGRLVGKW